MCSPVPPSVDRCRAGHRSAAGVYRQIRPARSAGGHPQNHWHEWHRHLLMLYKERQMFGDQRSGSIIPVVRMIVGDNNSIPSTSSSIGSGSSTSGLRSWLLAVPSKPGKAPWPRHGVDQKAGCRHSRAAGWRCEPWVIFMGWFHIGWCICNPLWGRSSVAISGPQVDYHHYRANWMEPS